MFPVTKLTKLFYWFFSVLPIILSTIASIRGSLIALVLAVIALFVAVTALPFAHKYENIWMFIFAALAGLPINIRLICMALNYWTLECRLFSLIITRCLVIGIMLFSAEELILGVITRKIWNNQCKVRIDYSDRCK